MLADRLSGLAWLFLCMPCAASLLHKGHPLGPSPYPPPLTPPTPPGWTSPVDPNALAPSVPPNAGGPYCRPELLSEYSPNADIISQNVNSFDVTANPTCTVDFFDGGCTHLWDYPINNTASLCIPNSNSSDVTGPIASADVMNAIREILNDQDCSRTAARGTKAVGGSNFVSKPGKSYSAPPSEVHKMLEGPRLIVCGRRGPVSGKRLCDPLSAKQYRLDTLSHHGFGAQ